MIAKEAQARATLVVAAIGRIWAWLRAVLGDDAYERYVSHWRTAHGPDGPDAPPLGRKEFFRDRQDEQWKDIRRCC